MYVAEKELCKGTLIEVEKLNDVKGVGRQKRKERPAAPAPRRTSFAFRGGVMARVTTTLPSGDPSIPTASAAAMPCVADGVELLTGLDEDERAAILHDDPVDGAHALTAADFTRPPRPEQRPDAWQPPPRARLLAPAPSWARERRKSSGRGDGPQQRLGRWRQQVVATEAETEDEPSEGEC